MGISHRDALHVYCAYDVELRAFAMMPSSFLKMCSEKKKKRCLGCDTEKAMAPHSSTLAWKIPWTEEPGRLQSMGSLSVRHD